MQKCSALKLFLQLLLFNFYLHVGAENEKNERVLGGEVAYPHEFPFVMFNGIPCSSVLIRPGWVMTAGHCLHERDLPILIWGGKTRWVFQKPEPTQVARAAIKLFIHPDYVEYGSQSDIGLLKLNASFELNEYIQPVTLVSKGYNEIECTWAVSFSLNCPGNPRAEERCYELARVSKVDLPIRENSVCEDFYGWQFNGTTMICAGGYAEGGKDTCSGDSGGPLVVFKDGKYVQVGITSWGESPCGKPGYPGAYTRITTFLDWIDETIRKEEEENGAP